MGRWMCVLSIVALVAGSLVANDHVGFVLKAVKNTRAGRKRGPEWFCFEMQSHFAETSSELLFLIDVVDTLPYHTDTSRFGGTNVDRGKQSLDMTIHNWNNGDLIRSKRNLPSGRSVIVANPLGARKFCFCFVNLSYDSSWRYLDVIKTITVRITTCDLVQKQQWSSQLRKDRTLESLRQIEGSVVELLGPVESTDGSELLELESERRDLNEQIFSWLMYGEAMFTIAVVASNILVTRHFIKCHRDRVRDARRRKIFNH